MKATTPTTQPAKKATVYGQAKISFMRSAKLLKRGDYRRLVDGLRLKLKA